MADGLQSGQVSSAARREQVVRATQVAGEAEVRESANGVRFATFGETGVPGPDLDRMLEAVPSAIAAGLGTNTYYFVPLALREPAEGAEGEAEPAVKKAAPEQAMVARAWSEDLGEAAICHRNVELGSGNRGVFISTRLMGDRFALSFEFFINVAHAFTDATGVPERFAALAWQQALDGARGETSLDAWESRNLAFGLDPRAQAEAPGATVSRRSSGFAAKVRPFSGGSTGQVASIALAASSTPAVTDEKERAAFLEAAFSDAVAIYLLSLALDLDYSELREREYPLLAPAALAARLRLVAELYPANPGYEFSVRYRRRA
ncbi:MAG TPA: hypothetical protein VM865_06555 [Acidobacteriaceae bacterium]|nr:hypothetical protein [Acidobacteriaceae bacterium]